MSTAVAPQTPIAVRFRHRRRPPALHIGIIVAVFLAILAVDLSSHLAQAALVLAALAAVGLGWLGRERLWVEDQLITDAAAIIAHADGARFEVPLDRVARVVGRGSSVVFVRDDGAELHFRRNPHRRRIQRLLAAAEPRIEWVDRIDPACDT